MGGIFKTVPNSFQAHVQSEFEKVKTISSPVEMNLSLLNGKKAIEDAD